MPFLLEILEKSIYDGLVRNAMPILGFHAIAQSILRRNTRRVALDAAFAKA